MNIRELKELIELMDEYGLMEVEVERQGMKIKLRRGSSGVPVMLESAPAAYAPPSAAPAAAAAKVDAHPVETGTIVKSPMVGTFYRAPAPDADSFVEVGQHVVVGQVLCIIEAMKLMNEIKSEIAGRIIKIPVENAQPIEFGQPIFIVEPA